MRSFVARVIKILLNPRAFFLMIAFLLIQLWFSKNLLLGGTEAGVPTLTPGKILQQIRWLWWEALGPGTSIPTAVASIPLYFFMSTLEQIGLKAIEIQKILFLMIVYLQGLGASLLFRAVASKESKLQILAGLFYIFNPFMMIIVWHRFTYSGFILSASLPFVIYFYIKLLETGNIKYILLFLLSSFLSSYMYSSIAPVLAVWLAVFICFLVAVVQNRSKLKEILRVLLLTLELFIFWVLTNLWWIYPLIRIETVLSVFSRRGNVDTLVTLSSQSTISNVIRGINPYILFLQKDWGDIYESLIFQSLSWISLIFILAGLLKRGYSGKIWYIIILFLMGIFVTKGAAEPLGKVTAWFYANFFFLGAVRNPFEKLGLLVVLPSSIIISLGVRNIWKLYKGIFLKLLVIVLIAGYAIYIHPMFSDKLFGSQKYPLFFTLPKDYEEVSTFLSKELESDYGKILHLPISEGDAATYIWDYPYNGVELASHLFPGSSISRFSYLTFIDQLLGETARIFHSADYQLQRYFLSNLGVKYILLNKNIDWYSRRVDSPQYLETILDASSDLQIIHQTENLKVYKFIAKSPPGVYSAGSAMLISGNTASGSVTDHTLSNLAEDNNVYLQLAKNQQFPPQLVGGEVTFPLRIFNSGLDPSENPDTVIARPFVRHLPDAFYYPLIILKEEFEYLLTPVFDRSAKLVFYTQKRLMEARILKEHQKNAEFKKALTSFANYLDRAIYDIRKEGELEVLDKIVLKVAFREEREILESLYSQVWDLPTKKLIEESLKKIADIHKEKGLEVFYEAGISANIGPGNVSTYQFHLSEKKDMEVMLHNPNPEIHKLENSGNFTILLDGIVKEVEIRKTDSSNIFSLVKIELDEGVHEIALRVDQEQDPSQTQKFVRKRGNVEFERKDGNLIKLTTDKEDAWVEYSIEDYNPDKIYLLQFSYRVIKGSPPQIQFWQDSDKLREGGEPKITRRIEDNLYNFDWKDITLSISTNNAVSVLLERNATKPDVRLLIPHWNNCEAVNGRKRHLCKSLDFRKAYNNPSVVEIRDLKIRESFNGMVYLKNDGGKRYVSEDLKFRNISPVEYQGEISADSPFLLILNESFHSGWKVRLNSDNKVVDEKNHLMVNGYANGWLIDENGKYSFSINFAPQNFLYQGILISGGSYLLFLIIFIRERLKK